MRRLARSLSVVFVAAVGLAAFVTAVVPHDRDDSPSRDSSPSSSTVLRRAATEEKRFVADGYSFAYPGAWTKGRERVTQVGRFTTAFGSGAATAVSPSTSGEALVVVAEPLREPFAEKHFDRYLRLIRKRVANEGERLRQSPMRVTVAGLPAVRAAVEFPDGAVRRYTVILERRTAYLLTCTFISKQMARGCDRVEESFHVD